MGRIARYAYLHARVSTHIDRLLEDRELDALIERPVGEEAELLRAKGLESLLGPAPRPSGSIEQRLIGILVQEFVVLVRALSGRAREFLVYWIYRYEFSNLKAILRGKMTGQPAPALRDALVDAGPFGRLPDEELLATEDVAELLRRLEGSPFDEVAREARRIYEQRHELFALDAAVDRRYFAGLWRRAREAGGREGKALLDLVGDIIDRLNLLWLLRYRFAYGLPPAETYYLLIPASYRLGSRELAALAQLASFEEVLARLPPPYAGLLAGSRDTPEVTRRLERYAWRRAERVLRHESFSLARVFAYLVLRERDLRRVRAILRGKQLQMPEPLIREAAALAGH